jgi:dolichol-phosphate mannosyltransferase
VIDPIPPGRSGAWSDPQLSVVVPVRDEADSVEPLVAEIRAALDGRVRYEVVYVDDGSVDDTPARLRACVQSTPHLRVLRHRAASGQSAAIRTGARAARGRLLATLDGDGQNDPADILRLLDVLMATGPAGPVLVIGERRRRRASWWRRLSSRAANAVRRLTLRDGVRDTGCGLKLLERQAFLDLPAFDHMHRFLPALFLRAGGRVVQVPVSDRPRSHGRSHYGVGDRLGVGLVDLLGVLWLARRPLRPAVEDLAPAEPAPGSWRLPGPAWHSRARGAAED